MHHLVLDRVDQVSAQRQRGNRDLLERRRFGITGDVVEEERRIAAERRVGAE